MINKAIDILFLSYFTNYQLKEIYSGIDSPDIGIFIENYNKRQKDAGAQRTDKQIEHIWHTTNERYEEMRFRGIRLIPMLSKEYPQNLKAISTPPPILYTKGRLKELHNIAIIGTRDTSAFAQSTIERITTPFRHTHFGIVSGLAVGIDKIAHECAIINNLYTLAVLPNSLDHVYPKENIRLANEIIDSGGGLVSELPIGINLGKRGFVQRNRLQSALSDVILPVEMGIESGTMHTVQFAVQQRKSLFIIRPNEQRKSLPQYEGINYLLNLKYQFLQIMDSELSVKDEFEQLMQKSRILSEGNNKVNLVDSSNTDKRLSQINDFISQINDIISIAKTELDSVKVKNSSYNSFDLKRIIELEIEKVEKMIRQRTMDFLLQHSAVSFKDLNKVVKPVLKKLKEEL